MRIFLCACATGRLARFPRFAVSSSTNSPTPAFFVTRRRRYTSVDAGSINPGMTRYHTVNEDLYSHEHTVSNDPAREMTRGPMATEQYDSRRRAGAPEDVAGESGSSDFRRHKPYNLRPSGRRQKVRGPLNQPAPGQQADFDYGGQEHAQPAFGPNAFGNTLQQPFAPPHTQFAGAPFGQDQFGSFTPQWNNLFNMYPAANTLPFMPPPFFFPSPVLQAPGAPFNTLPSFPFDPSTIGGFDGNLQNGVQTPKVGPHSRSPSKPPEPPKPTEQYLSQASLPAKQLPTPQPLLVILDLNGTLVYRKHRKYPPVFTKRPGLTPFLKTLLEKYKVMIWSSSQPHTVKAICETLFTKEKRKELVGEWGRNTLGLSKSQYAAKTQVYKKLETVWASAAVQATYPGATKPSSKKKKKKKQQQQQQQSLPQPGHQRWDQTNTVLIDDSKLKAISEPFNIIEVPEFTNAPDVDESNVFTDVLNRLNVLSRHDDVSKVLRQLSDDPASFPVLSPDNEDTSIQVEVEAEPEQQPQLKLLTKKEIIREAKARRQQKELARQQAGENKVHPKVAAKRQKGKKRKAASADAAGPDPTALAIDTGAITVPQEQPKPSTLSSPLSPSSQSENFLLDRLEESLNVQRD